MTQEPELRPDLTARAVVETLIPPAQRGVEWDERWDRFEQLRAEYLEAQELRRRYLANDGEAGSIDQDVLAAACLLRGVDL